jgi:hypothetical protein
MDFEPPSVSQPLEASVPQASQSRPQQMQQRPVRNWSMEPTSSDVPVSSIFKKITDPQSIWCVVTGSGLSFVIASLVLLYFKPNLIVDDATGRVCPKKLIFVSLVVGGCVFGISFYLQRKYT